MSFSFGGGIVKDGLILHLDAGNSKSYVSGSLVWNDLSKNQNNGSLISGSVYTGSAGGAIYFDGVNDYVDCGVTNLTLSANITLSAWINQSILTGYGNIITKEGSTIADLDYGFTTSVGGNLYFWFYNGGYKIHETFTNNINQTDTWYNVAAVFSDTNNTVQLYANGIQIYNQPETTSMVSHTNSKLFVGWRNSFYAVNRQLFKGNISIVQIYNRALTPSEVLQNYNAQKSKFGL